MNRSFHFIFWVALSVAGSFSLSAQTNSPEVSDKPSKIFAFNEASPEEIQSAVTMVATPGAKIVLMPRVNKIYVQDTPQKLSEIAILIAQLDVPKPNIRIDLQFDEDNQIDRNSGGAVVDYEVGDVRIRGGQPMRNGNNVVISPGGNNSFALNSKNRTYSSSSRTTQFLVTRSGSPASIRIAQDVPLVDYFYQYATQVGVLTPVITPSGSTNLAVVPTTVVTTTPQIRWQSVGTQMSVVPTQIGNLIRVDITPEITAYTDRQGLPSQTPRGSYNQPQVISFRNLTTSVTIANGGTISLGGFHGASDTFNRSFFTRSANGRTQSSNFTLKATILPPGQGY